MRPLPEDEGTVFDIRTVTSTCSRCGNDFETQQLVIEGRSSTPKICGSCVEEERGLYHEPARQMLDRADRMPELLEAIGVNVRRHGRCTLEPADDDGVGFDTTEAGTTPLRAARAFVTEVLEAGKWAPVRGLLICGPTGTGKTHLAVGILRALILNRGINPDRLVMDRAARLITEIQDTYGTGQTGAMLEKREGAHVWVLDDLGAEKATPDSLRILHDLLDAREGHPTIITSNLTPQEMGARFRNDDGWVRIASRLGGQNFRAILVKGRDRRFAA